MRKRKRKPAKAAHVGNRHASFRLRNELIERIDGEAKKMKVSRAKHVQDLLTLAYVTIEGKNTLAHKLQGMLRTNIAAAFSRRVRPDRRKIILRQAC